MLIATRRCCAVIAVLTAFAVPLAAQGAPHETAPPDLVRTIAAQDSALFAAYNSCALDAFARFWTPDVEFYHDQGGLMIGGENVVAAVRANICGRTTRQLVAGSDTVFIMKGYGALHSGRHRFYRAGAESSGAVGEARFMHLWKLDGGTWRLTRVFSFDHRPLND